MVETALLIFGFAAGFLFSAWLQRKERRDFNREFQPLNRRTDTRFSHK